MSPAIFYENVTVITGASSGIGHELAYQMAEQGAWLVLAARNEGALEETAQICRQRGGRAITVPTDVTDQDQCQRLIQQAVEEYGRIDTLVNNAGITMWALFEEIHDLDLFHKIMRVNYFGTVYCTHYALPYLKETRGRIVAVASLAALNGIPTRSAYAASKHASKGFMDTLRIELAGSGISVTISYPDFVATGMRERALKADGTPLGESPLEEGKVMTTQDSVRSLLTAMEQRAREDKQTLRGKAGPWIKLIAPGLIDNMARNALLLDD